MMVGQAAQVINEVEARKPGWKTVKFGDVVKLSNARCSNPAAAGIGRYVGLEHIEPEDLRIRRWGLVEEGTTFTTLFKPGQVLFGKRRAYQRKVAVADFEGVCSGDIYVFESIDPQVLLPELLPFICQTDRFFEYAIGTSAGSLSPRTNWKSLLNFEFVLPPITMQKEILELLSAFMSMQNALSILDESIHQLREASLTSIFSACDKSIETGILKEIGQIEFPSTWRLLEADKLSDALITKGATPSKHITDKSTGIPFIKVYNLTFDGILDFTVNPTFITEAGHAELSRSTVIGGDILMNIVGPPLGKVAFVPLDFPEANINQAIVRYRFQDSNIRKWLCWYLQSSWAKSWFMKRSKKTSGQRNLTLEMCREIPVPLPPPKELLELINRIEQIERSKKASGNHLQVLSRQVHDIRFSTLG